MSVSFQFNKKPTWSINICTSVEANHLPIRTRCLLPVSTLNVPTSVTMIITILIIVIITITITITVTPRVGIVSFCRVLLPET